ncbi:phage holin family protein [Pseudomonas borbori]
MDDATPDSSIGRGPSPRRFAAALLGLAHGHIALLGEELKEQQGATLRLLALASLSLFFALLLIIGLSAALLISLWDSYRLAAIGGLCLVYGLGLLCCLMALLSQLRNATPPFSASLEELARDREQLLP